MIPTHVCYLLKTAVISLDQSRGALNFGLRAMCHQKDPTFFHSLSPKDPHFYQLSPKDPLFFKNFDIFDEMLRNFWPFWPWKPLFFDAFHWKTPYFCALCHWKTPFFDAICHQKTPTFEVLGGTRLVRHFHIWVPPPPGRSIYTMHWCNWPDLVNLKQAANDN